MYENYLWPYQEVLKGLKKKKARKKKKTHPAKQRTVSKKGRKKTNKHRAGV